MISALCTVTPRKQFTAHSAWAVALMDLECNDSKEPN